jgi:hypothetical protein
MTGRPSRWWAAPAHRGPRARMTRSGIVGASGAGVAGRRSELEHEPGGHLSRQHLIYCAVHVIQFASLEDDRCLPSDV